MADAYASGWLTKQGGSVRSWKRRWCIVKQGNLVYYVDKGDSTPQGSINLTSCTYALALYSEIKKEFCFKIITGKRTYFFCAESEAETVMWIDALVKAGIHEDLEEVETIVNIKDSIDQTVHNARSVIDGVTRNLANVPDLGRAVVAHADLLFQQLSGLNKFVSPPPSRSTAPNILGEKIREAIGIASGILDSTKALALIARDMHESKQRGDESSRGKMGAYCETIINKVTQLRQLIEQDDPRGLRYQMRLAMFGRSRAPLIHAPDKAMGGDHGAGATISTTSDYRTKEDYRSSLTLSFSALQEEAASHAHERTPGGLPRSASTSGISLSDMAGGTGAGPGAGGRPPEKTVAGRSIGHSFRNSFTLRKDQLASLAIGEDLDANPTTRGSPSKSMPLTSDRPNSMSSLHKSASIASISGVTPAGKVPPGSPSVGAMRSQSFHTPTSPQSPSPLSSSAPITPVTPPDFHYSSSSSQPSTPSLTSSSSARDLLGSGRRPPPSPGVYAEAGSTPLTPLSPSMSTSSLLAPSPGTSPGLTTQRTQFELIVSLSRELAHILKTIEPTITPNPSNPFNLPKMGYIKALTLVKTARDFAYLLEDFEISQEILNAAGRVFFITTQIFTPPDASVARFQVSDQMAGAGPTEQRDAALAQEEADESIQKLYDALKTLSMSVVQLIRTILDLCPHVSQTPGAGISGGVGVPAANGPLVEAPSKIAPTQTSAPSMLSSLSLPASHHQPRKGGTLDTPPRDQPPRKSSKLALFDEIGPNPSSTKEKEKDVDIWDEVQQEGVNVVFNDEPGEGGGKTLKAGTLNQIVMLLTNEEKPNLKFVKTFITTYQSFTTPEMFLRKLVQRYRVPEHVDSKKILPIQLRVINVLRMWADTQFKDFTSELVDALNIFLEVDLKKDGHVKLADAIASVIQRQNGPRRAKGTLIVPAYPTLGTAAFWNKYTVDFFSNLDEEEIAKQLCLIDFDTYKSIEPVELLNQAWNKPALRFRSPNVMRMITRFNSISFWVSRLLAGEERVKTRGRIMVKILKMAQVLYKLGNFNSLLAVLSGLNHSAIYRLKFTMEEVPSSLSSEIQKYNDLFSSDKGYRNYRAHVHRVNPPLVPYLGVYLTDLTFMEDGNPNIVNNLINFKKREMIYNVIMEIQQYQNQAFTFAPQQSLIQYLSDLPIVDDTKAMDTELYNMSLAREPRNATKSDVL